MSDFAAPPIGPQPAKAGEVYSGLMQEIQAHSLRDSLRGVLSDIGNEYANEAHGFWENAKFQGLAAGKAFADGIAHLGVTPLRLGFQAGRMLRGKSWGEGGQEFGDLMRMGTGSTDPGAFDLVAGPWSDTSEMSVGQRTDKLLSKRLGAWSAAGESIGAIASFAAGPGGALGRESASLIRPMGLAAERAVARRLARGAVEGADPAVVGVMLRSGQPLQALAQLPEWQAQASRLTKTLAWGGRHLSDLMSTTGSLALQSYAMSDEQSQGTAAMSALLTGPLIVPIARAGQALAAKVAQAGIRGPAAERLANIYRDLEGGKITVLKANELIREAVPAQARSMLGNAVSSAFEGTAFTWMHGDSWKDYQAWSAGDSEAGARLAAAWLGSVAGIAVTKHWVPTDLAPLFQSVRPDLNRLRTWAEAEASTMESSQLQGFGTRKRILENAQQEPKPQEPTRPDPWPIKIEEAVRQYDWAETPTRGLIGGGFRPIWDAATPFAGGERVKIQFGNEEPVDVAREGSGIRVSFSPNIRDTLEAFRPGVTSEGGPTRQVVDRATGVQAEQIAQPKIEAATGTTLTGSLSATGEHATRILDALSMLGTYRRIQGDLQFGRMGFREVAPGVWADDANGQYWTMELDGTSTRRKLDGSGKAKETLIAVGGYGDPQFTSPSLEAMTGLVMSHNAIAPDPLVDGILSQAILLAQHGDSVGARNLRGLFQTLTGTELAAALKPESQDFLAMQVGMVGGGTSNPSFAAESLRAAAGNRERPAHPPGEPVDPATLGPVREPEMRSDKATGTPLGEGVATPAETQAPREIVPGEPVDPATLKPYREPPPPKGDPATGTSMPRQSLGEQIATVGPQPTLPTSPRIARTRLEDLIALHMDRGDQATVDKLQSILATGSPEQIAAAVKEYGTAESGSLNPFDPRTRAQLWEAAKAVARAGKSVMDWAITDRISSIRSRTQDPVARQWLDEMDVARSGQRTLRGEARDLFRAAERELKRMGGRSSEIVTVDGDPMPRWQALAEGRIEPANEREATVAKSIRDTALYLWDAANAEGFRRWVAGPDGQLRFERLGERDQARIPRMQGPDWERVYSNREDRRALFEWLIERNGLTIRDAETKQLRRMTVDEMETKWADEQVGSRVERAQRESAFEFVRELKHFPAVFRGFHILETNPFEAMRRLTEQQSGRIAAARVWGPDFNAQEIAAIKAEDRNAVIRPGAEASLRAMQRALVREGERTPSFGGRGRLATLAEDVLVTLQGGQPNELHWLWRKVAPVEGLARSAMTTASFIHDIPAPIVQGTAYAGFRRMVKSVLEFARSPWEAIVQAQRAGSLIGEMGAHDFQEASGKLQKVTDLLAWLGTKSERVKTAMFDVMARNMLRDWERGRVTGNDRDVLREMLSLPQETQDALLANRATDQQKKQFRHEFVKLTTGRRSRVEGSEFLASPNLQKLVRFGNWITGRMVEVGRAGRALGRADATMQQRARALGRTLTLLTGWSASGVATSLMYYLFADMFRGENGAKRWLQEAGAAPWSMIARGLGGQLAGGPISSAMRAASSNEARDWAQLTSLTSFGWALKDAVESGVASWPLGAVRAIGDASAAGLTESGLLPRYLKDAAVTVGAAIAGKDPGYRTDARMIRTWERLNNVQRPEFARTRVPQYYDALSRIHDAILKAKGTPEERSRAVLVAAEADIREALALAPEESVAASIRAMQLLDDKPPEQRQAIAELSDDDQQMQRIYAHDLTMRELAKAIGRMHGENPATLDAEIEQVESQARLGDTSQWGKLIDRSLEDAVLRIQAREPHSSGLRAVAESLAAFPGHLTDVLAPRQARALMRPGISYAYRARMLTTILERRARERVTEDRKRGMLGNQQ